MNKESNFNFKMKQQKIKTRKMKRETKGEKDITNYKLKPI